MKIPRIPNPANDGDIVRCGHNFLINRCPLEKCCARELYQMLRDIVCAMCNAPYGHDGERTYPDCPTCLKMRTLLARVREEEVAPGPESAE